MRKHFIFNGRMVGQKDLEFALGTHAIRTLASTAEENMYLHGALCSRFSMGSYGELVIQIETGTHQELDRWFKWFQKSHYKMKQGGQ